MLAKPINPNYCASVVELGKFVPIENANAIQCAVIFGNSVIVSIDTQLSTKGLYFPLECKISSDFLSKHNLFRDKTLNADQDQVGFFESNGRVRALRLRGTKSEGFFISFDALCDEYAGLRDIEVGTDFDHWNDKLICRKYVVREPQARKERQGRAIVMDRLIDNQFHLHVDTLHAKKNFNIIKPTDIISITDKLHGTSAVFANVLVKKKLNWFQRLLTKVFDLVDYEYGDVYSSRRVIKNKSLNPDVQSGYYGTDIWGQYNEQLKHLIPEGVTLYGEIVGYTADKKLLQPGYAYNHEVGASSFYVYRITHTSMTGRVYEFSWGQIAEFCNKYGLKAVPLFYYGYARDLYPDIETTDHWHEEVIERMSTDFNLEKECKYNPGHPAEGVVIRRDELFDCVPLKLKAFKFLQYETKMLDAGIDVDS